MRLASFVRAASFVLAAIAFATGCTKVDAPAGSGREASGGGNPWTHHGDLIYAEPQDAKSLNPILAANAVTGDLTTTRRDPSRSPYGRSRRSRTATSAATA
jgi:hypothetical protein